MTFAFSFILFIHPLHSSDLCSSLLQNYRSLLFSPVVCVLSKTNASWQYTTKLRRKYAFREENRCFMPSGSWNAKSRCKYATQKPFFLNRNTERRTKWKQKQPGYEQDAKKPYLNLCLYNLTGLGCLIPALFSGFRCFACSYMQGRGGSYTQRNHRHSGVTIAKRAKPQNTMKTQAWRDGKMITTEESHSLVTLGK